LSGFASLTERALEVPSPVAALRPCTAHSLFAPVMPTTAQRRVRRTTKSVIPNLLVYGALSFLRAFLLLILLPELVKIRS
jgi:hypothetical protein